MIEDHNAARYLRVVYRDTRVENEYGWVVIRTCPCHVGIRVTQHYRTKAEADRVKQILIETVLS